MPPSPSHPVLSALLISLSFLCPPARHTHSSISAEPGVSIAATDDDDKDVPGHETHPPHPSRSPPSTAPRDSGASERNEEKFSSPLPPHRSSPPLPPQPTHCGAERDHRQRALLCSASLPLFTTKRRRRASSASPDADALVSTLALLNLSHPPRLPSFSSSAQRSTTNGPANT